MKTIYLAGGCFWGTEHYIRQFEGVLETVAGYANGDIPNPSYEQVYTDETGFVECVKVTYDPEIISLKTLCRLFFKSINPLLKNRQGNDYGTRYRTGIYWPTEGMKEILWEEGDTNRDRMYVEQVFDEIQSRYGVALAVEKGPLECFYPAEDYHQDYLIKNPEGYCHLSINTMRSAKEYARITQELRALSTEEKRLILPRFFKTGKGEYAEGDKFIGTIVPDSRRVAKTHTNASYETLEALLESDWHEHRLCALLILREKYQREPEHAVEFYLKHTSGINNWDLVDLSAPYILGAFLSMDSTNPSCTEKNNIIYKLAASANMWEQRIAVVATLALIRRNRFNDTIRLAEMLMDTKHDLMQKAIGWMLREVGKRDEQTLKDFIDRYKTKMPRTMLRYAIEKFPSAERKAYLSTKA